MAHLVSRIKNNLKTKNNQKGVVLVLTVFAIAFSFILILGVLEISTIDLQIVRNYQKSVRALYIAEAGVEDAIYELRQNHLWNTGFTNKLFANETYTVTITNNYPNVIINTTSTITGNFQKQMQVQISISGPPYTPPYPVRVVAWQEI
ncbi:hypothetical protein HOC37_03390 [bacterium]|jgi:Tfp pilus assembly protein PilX|nr:hypothetical protein [bacterium]MBT3581613.1 hypothetical protein [bacterium]MBT4552012.1 hypothetical protein [bacterium]